MHYMRNVIICFCVTLHGAVAWGQEDIPGALYQKALRIIHSAQQESSRKDSSAALGKYRQAERDLRILNNRYPDYEPAEVNAQISGCQEKIALIGEESFQIPTGYLRVWTGMTQERNRYEKGRLLARKVKKIGDDEYEVGDYTVRLVRSGKKIGASCSGPDFKYRGLKEDFACKHIWAVIIKERLLERTGEN
jgi:hypothetical protein